MTKLELKPSQIIISLMESFAGLMDEGLRGVSTSKEEFDHPNLRAYDAVLKLCLQNLNGYPASKWIALCEALEPTPILIAAATYCDEFAWINISEAVQRLQSTGELLDETYRAGQYVNPSSLKDASGQAIKSFSQLASLSLPLSIIQFFMPALHSLDYDVSPEQLKKLNPILAKLVAWDWIKYGIPTGYVTVLKKWMSEACLDKSLRFWSQFGIDLRAPQKNVDLQKLEELAQFNAQKAFVANFKHILDQGPFTKEEALFLLDNLEKGDVFVAQQRFLRFAYWLPQQAPLVAISSSSQLLEDDLQNLKNHINMLVENDIPFI